MVQKCLQDKEVLEDWDWTIPIRENVLLLQLQTRIQQMRILRVIDEDLDVNPGNVRSTKQQVKLVVLL